MNHEGLARGGSQSSPTQEAATCHTEMAISLMISLFIAKYGFFQGSNAMPTCAVQSSIVPVSNPGLKSSRTLALPVVISVSLGSNNVKKTLGSAILGYPLIGPTESIRTRTGNSGVNGIGMMAPFKAICAGCPYSTSLHFFITFR